jgi:predicted anti-sigma-YlaC factor YlaD
MNEINKQCEEFRDKIVDYIIGSLPENEAVEIQKHISDCADCRQYHTALCNEDSILTGWFDGLQETIDRQQDDVIKAIGCLQTSKADKAIARINGFLNNPVFKLSAAAAIIIIVAFYSIKTMSWLYDLEHFMDICSVTIK